MLLLEDLPDDLLARVCSALSLEDNFRALPASKRIVSLSAPRLAIACRLGKRPFYMPISLITRGPDVNLYARQLGEAGCSQLGAALGAGALEHCSVLTLANNQIDGACVRTILRPCIDCGALSQLWGLYLANNLIGNAGLVAIVEACAAGALPVLRRLGLSKNRIGAEGLAQAFAGRQDALAGVTSVCMQCNPMGDAGIEALAGGCERGALASCEELVLYSGGGIGDAGAGALARAAAAGGLRKLKRLDLTDNDIGSAGCLAFAEAISSADHVLELLEDVVGRMREGHRRGRG